MNIYDFMGILAFLATVGVVLAKMFNLMDMGKLYDIKIGFILFITAMIGWLLIFSGLASFPERMIYLTLFKLNSWLLVLTTLFTFIEVLMLFVSLGRKPVKARNSLAELRAQ